jgi:pimeloyl-ACP methyl ester carboxylesterase
VAASLPTPSDPAGRLVETAAGTVAISEEGPGDGLPILCVHGIPGSRRDFRYLAPLLADRFRVLRVEMPGFGESPAGPDAHLAAWAKVLLAVPAALGLERFALLGHSFGGGALLLAGAQAGDRLAGLVLLASMGARRHRSVALPPAAYAALMRLMELPLARPVIVALGRSFYRRIGLAPPETWQELYRHTSLIASVRFSELADGARRTTAPALVAHCLDDRLVEAAIARELAALLPLGRLVEYESGGHHLQKTRAHDLAADITSFLTAPARDG